MVNKVILTGNVGQDPEIRSTQDGRKIATFSVATTERWKDKNTGEKKEQTEWHRVVVFNQGLVSIIERYVKKGTKLYVEGNLQTRKWQDDSGNDRWSTEVTLRQIGGTLELLGGKAAGTQDHNEAPAQTHEEALDDDIPF